jgi:hypothetical protein
MFDQLAIRILTPGPRRPAQIQLLVNGEDLVDEAADPGSYGPNAVDVLPPLPSE